MKKVMNSPVDYVDEMLEGLCLAHDRSFRQPVKRVIVRASGATEGKVGIVTGGGSGHLPIFTGYIGPGLLDAAAIGDVFASPSAEQIANAMRHANGGAGILCLYGNYGGDIMNFDMASEMLAVEDIASTTVVVADDVASAPKSEAKRRRGVAGMVYAFKVAGARAAERANLGEVAKAAQEAADACRSIGFALGSCTLPQAGVPTFDLPSDEMEMGIGIHGERGLWRAKLKTADELADEMLDRLLDDFDLGRGERVSLLVNSLGATPLEELYIMYRRLAARLTEKDVTIVQPLVGRYATSMEMSGATVTLCRLDGQLERLLAAPCECPFWKS